MQHVLMLLYKLTERGSFGLVLCAFDIDFNKDAGIMDIFLICWEVAYSMDQALPQKLPRVLPQAMS